MNASIWPTSMTNPTRKTESAPKAKGKTKNRCWCGCGGLTNGKFVPGHDAKFHGLAKKVARDLEEMPDAFEHEEAEADFMKWYNAERPIHLAKVAEKKAAKKKDEAPVEDEGDEETLSTDSVANSLAV